MKDYYHSETSDAKYVSIQYFQLLLHVGLISDVAISGEVFPPSPTNPMLLAGDEYINGKLVKNTLSGDQVNL